MNYLKTFEGFAHYSINDRFLFIKTTYEELEKIQSDSSGNYIEKITTSDCEWFIKLLSENISEPFKIEEFTICKRFYNDKEDSAINVKLLPKFNKYDYTEIILYKYSDDYWFIECMGYGNAYFNGVNNIFTESSDWTYWLCDTKDGVKNCIEYYFNTIRKYLSELPIV
jgi:hypothetical protein